jgi:broad specificity phosphatase PhoE
VSDLQCPARILVVRHGEAAYREPDVPSDDGGWLTQRGRAQATALAHRLRDERVAAVYTSRLALAQETGQIVADELGVPATAVDGVQELSVGAPAGRPETDPEARPIYLGWLTGDLDLAVPGGETGMQVVTRFRLAVEELADRHRGETVVVVSHGGVMSLAVPHTAGNVSPGLSRDSLLEDCAVVTLEVDADGWRLVGPWPGRAEDAEAL